MLFKDERLYRPDEVAKRLNISIKSIYRMIKDVDDPLPAIKIKNIIRLPGNRLNEYIKRHTIKSWEE